MMTLNTRREPNNKTAEKREIFKMKTTNNASSKSPERIENMGENKEYMKDICEQLRLIGVSALTLDLGRDNSVEARTDRCVYEHLSDDDKKEHQALFDANPENIAMYCDKTSVYGDGPRRVFLNQVSTSDPVFSAWRYLKGVADAYEVWNADSEVQQEVVIDAKEGSITFSEN